MLSLLWAWPGLLMNVMLDLPFELLISLFVGSRAAVGCAVVGAGYNGATGIAICWAAIDVANAIDVADWKGVVWLTILVTWAME